MADAQKAESTPSPDTEGVRLAKEFARHCANADEQVGHGNMARLRMEFDTFVWDKRHAIAALLRTAQNTGRDEVLEALPTSTAAKDALERAIKAAGRHDAWPSSRAAKDTEAVVAAIRSLSSPPVSTVDEEGGGS